MNSYIDASHRNTLLKANLRPSVYDSNLTVIADLVPELYFKQPLASVLLETQQDFDQEM